MHLFFSVGEPSGDQHAAHLIEELRRRCPDVRITGYGGPLMEQAGYEAHFRLTDIAVMGFIRIFPLLWKFIRLIRQAGRFFERERPDAVILVDCPGFNWWIARKAKKAGIPVFYYMPPQLWAWASWRIRRVRKFVDHVLCALPFEYQWYASRGVSAHNVGHPFFDEVADYPLNRAWCNQQSAGDGKVVAVLPGSRTAEVTWNWPHMVKILRRLHLKHPEARFLVACYKPRFEELCRGYLEERGIELPIEFHVGKTPEIIEIADCALMVSGSVSLEMLARQTPAVVLYSLPKFHRMLMRIVVPVKFISLPNLIADRVVMPEWIVSWNPRRDVHAMTATLDRWLSDPVAYNSALLDLSKLRRDVVQTGATGRAADVILTHLPTGIQRAAA